MTDISTTDKDREAVYGIIGHPATAAWFSNHHDIGKQLVQASANARQEGYDKAIYDAAGAAGKLHDDAWAAGKQEGLKKAAKVADKSRPHYPKVCGCGECIGVAVAIEAIRDLGEKT